MASDAGDQPMSVPRLEAELPPLRVDGRIARAREQLSRHELAGAVFMAPANVRWLTGFTGSNGTVVITDQTAVLVTDGRYAEQAPAQLAEAGCGNDVEVVIANSAADAVEPRLSSLRKVGLEDTASWRVLRSWQAALSAEIVPTSALIEQLRAVKDEAEIVRMSAAAQIADQAVSEVTGWMRPGVTERDVQFAIDDAMRQCGASGPAYDTIVASGPNSALPHARPGDRVMQEGDLVVIDAGACVDGYRSDMTRTFVLGEPTVRAAEMLEAVTRSQAAGVATVSPGVKACEIDAACRQSLADDGMAEAFIHGTGHGVGLDIHELPRISRKSHQPLSPGEVLTVEPGVYYAGFGGVRVEDLLLVTDNRSVPLTRMPKRPVLQYT